MPLEAFQYVPFAATEVPIEYVGIAVAASVSAVGSTLLGGIIYLYKRREEAWQRENAGLQKQLDIAHQGVRDAATASGEVIAAFRSLSDSSAQMYRDGNTINATLVSLEAGQVTAAAVLRDIARDIGRLLERRDASA